MSKIFRLLSKVTRTVLKTVLLFTSTQLSVFAEDRMEIKPMQYPVPADRKPNILEKMFSVNGLIVFVIILVICVALVFFVNKKKAKK